MTLSIAIHTWNRPPEILNNSLWTLSHQSVLPDEIVVAETSPDGETHDATKALCVRYPLVKVVDAYWSRINVSRAANIAIRRCEGDYIAVVAMETLFSENFVKVLTSKLSPDTYNRAACGSLGPDVQVPEPNDAWLNWDSLCSQVFNDPPLLAPGALYCTHRSWWFSVRGFDEARRPFSYPDVDVYNRAYRSGLNVENGNIDWTEAQILHPWHPPSGLFYSVSGYAVDARVDASVRRNDWGVVEGDEWQRLKGKGDYE